MSHQDITAESNLPPPLPQHAAHTPTNTGSYHSPDSDAVLDDDFAEMDHPVQVPQFEQNVKVCKVLIGMSVMFGIGLDVVGMRMRIGAETNSFEEMSLLVKVSRPCLIHGKDCSPRRHLGVRRCGNSDLTDVQPGLMISFRIIDIHPTSPRIIISSSNFHIPFFSYPLAIRLYQTQTLTIQIMFPSFPPRKHRSRFDRSTGLSQCRYIRLRC